MNREIDFCGSGKMDCEGMKRAKEAPRIQGEKIQKSLLGREFCDADSSRDRDGSKV